MSATAVRPFEHLRAMPPAYQETLSRTAHLLLQDSDPDTLCGTVFEEIRERFELDVYFHFLVSPDLTHLELASSGGKEEVRAALGTRLTFGEAVCGTVAQRCEGMHLTGVQQRTDAMTELIRSFGVRSYACYPVMVHDRVVGTLSLGSTHRDSFQAEELEVFQLLVRQLSIATERRMQSERLRELERLAAAGRMSAMLAHEINNPLDTLTTLLYVLRSEVRGDEGSELVHKAEDQVAKLAEISRRTLETFRGKNQKAYPVDLSSVARDLVADVRLPQHTRLRSEIEDKLCVEAIPGELRQVIFNLLTNAAQFTPPGKEVFLTVASSQGYAEVRVRDEGQGISEESRGKLFQPFFTTRENGGTGVGLWLSKEMVERAGGTLTFESDPAVRPGTEFIVRLPLLD